MIRLFLNVFKLFQPWNWFKRNRAVGIILLDNKGRVLLLKRSIYKDYARGKWETPGGELYAYESFENAVDRRVKELLGVRLIDKEFLFENRFSPNEQGISYHAQVFQVLVDGLPQIQDKKDSAKMGWFPLQKLADLRLTIYTRQDFIYLGWIR